MTVYNNEQLSTIHQAITSVPIPLTFSQVHNSECWGLGTTPAETGMSIRVRSAVLASRMTHG